MRQPRIFTPMAGGLGDILTNYLDGELGYFPVLHNNGAETAVKLWSVCNHAPDLFAYHPHVDHVLSEPFSQAHGKTDTFRDWAADGEMDFRLMTEPERTAPWVRQPFYLSPEEQAFWHDIEAGGPYIAIHPFAGGPARSLVKHDLARIIVTAAACRNRVVILGGDSVRNGLTRQVLIEKFEIKHPNVLILVNNYSVRLHAHVASKATAFIGGVSAYNCVAHCCGIPALVFGSTDNRRSMLDGSGSIFAKMRERATPIHYIDTPINYPKLVGAFCEKYIR